MTPAVDLYTAAQVSKAWHSALCGSSTILTRSHCLRLLRDASVTERNSIYVCLRCLRPVESDTACLLRRSAPHTEYVLDYVVERKRVDDLAGRLAPLGHLALPSLHTSLPALRPWRT